jgi:hypothetical protein
VKSVIPVTALMHIRPDQSASAGCKDMPAQQFFILSQPTLAQNCPAITAAVQPLCALQYACCLAAFKFEA